MPQLPRRILIAQTAALFVVLAIVLPAEVDHWNSVHPPGSHMRIENDALGTQPGQVILHDGLRMLECRITEWTATHVEFDLPDDGVLKGPAADIDVILPSGGVVVTEDVIFSWIYGFNADSTLALIFLAVLPYCFFVRRPFWAPRSRVWAGVLTWWRATPEARGMLRGELIAIPMIVITSFAVSLSVSVSTIRPGEVPLLQGLRFDYEQYRFGDLPPAYHDEYSYLFQAKTYLAGRLSCESHPTAARLFDQMHVLNEGRFASRYFPATGLFVAPWLWLGLPIVGHWLTGAATAALVFGIGREISNNGTGFVAGMLTALSPGMALFANLVLAHHPTLLGLFFFAWSFVRWQRTGRVRDVAFAGVGLSWAMLCRPMTAAGFGLPFGIVFVAKLLRLWDTQTRSVSEGRMVPDRRGRFLNVRFLSRFLSRVLSHEVATENSRGRQPPENESTAPLSPERATQPFEPKASVAPSGLGDCKTIETGGSRPRLPPAAASRLMTLQLTTLQIGLASPHLLAMAVPLVVGFVVLAAHNRAITGSVMMTPYQLFTDIYTPRHMYGFYNKTRGEQHLSPRVLENYDRWAEDLTPALAVENSKNRLIASWHWTVGLLPLLAATVVFVLTGSSRDRRWWLIVAAIVSLFAVHVPYWFVGMFDWHYVFETGPLWCLVLAAATDTLGRVWLAAERPRMPVWWGLVIVSAVAVNLFEFAPLWYPSKLELAVKNVAFSRLRYQAFNELLKREVRDRPALVLIEADPADRHIDYVVNEPSLSADVLRGRFPVADWPLDRIAAEFPDRALYLFNAKTGELRLLTRRKLQNAK